MRAHRARFAKSFRRRPALQPCKRSWVAEDHPAPDLDSSDDADMCGAQAPEADEALSACEVPSNKN